MNRTQLYSSAIAAAMLSLAAAPAFAEDYTISVWAGGTNPPDAYRLEAIEMAADMLEREYALEGKELNIQVEKRRDFGGWDQFKQAFTLAAEAGKAPNIAVTSHLDIAPWTQAGYIVPIEDYIDIDSWPTNNIYPNLISIARLGNVQWGIPQDSESRPMFFWRDTMRKIGYSDAQIDALPERVATGDYTLHDVLEDAKKAVNAGIVEKGYGFYPRVSNGPDYAQFYQSFGGKLVDPETGKLLLDRKSMTDFYQFFVDCVNAGVTRRNHIGTEWNQWYNEVSHGKAAIWHGGTWHYARYIKEGNEDFFGTIQFSLIPKGNKDEGRPNTITHPLVYLLAKQGDEDTLEIAAKLIKIASEPRINALHAIKSAHLGISPLEQDIDFYANDRWAREATARLLPYANAQPNNQKYGQFSQIMWKGLEAAWGGIKSPEDAVAEVEQEMKAALGDDLIIR